GQGCRHGVPRSDRAGAAGLLFECRSRRGTGRPGWCSIHSRPRAPGTRSTRRLPHNPRAHPGTGPGCGSLFWCPKEIPMLRRFVAAFVVLLALVGLSLADEFKGKITKVEADKNNITVKASDKEESFRVGRRAKILNDKGDEIKIGDLKVDSEVTIKYD